MQLPRFLLDDWLTAHEFASPPIQFNLASSTGPAWTLDELAATCNLDWPRTLGETKISYLPPAGGAALRAQIAMLHDVDPEWVVVTTGASEALSVLYCLASEPGVVVLLPDLGCPAMPAFARAWGLDVVHYPLRRETAFAHSAQEILAAVDGRVRLVVVNTPHNPTGSVMPLSEIKILAAALATRNIPLVVDEVYHPLYFGDREKSAADIPNVVVVNDLSKALSLSGLRIGWLIERDERRRMQLVNLRSYFTICGSPITESIATHALRRREQIVGRLQAVATKNLASLDRFVTAHQNLLGWVRPVGGTTAFPWMLDGSNARAFVEACANRGVLFAPGDCFDAPEHFRIGFGAQSSGFEDALAIASGVLAGGPP
ncbi:MAG: pyridoxal phosphate-dependent aminotransferase [Steroidobacteraceae bacterium]